MKQRATEPFGWGAAGPADRPESVCLRSDRRIEIVLTKKDRWVGKAITSARMAYECWTRLLSGEIKIEPESSANLIGGGYANVFANYSKEAFLAAVAVLHRGLFKKENDVLVKTETAHRMLEVVSEEQWTNSKSWLGPCALYGIKTSTKKVRICQSGRSECIKVHPLSAPFPKITSIPLRFMNY